LNFLAHLCLAGNDEDLRLGAMLGDFVRGKEELEKFDSGVQSGIMLHRYIDVQTDALPEIGSLLEWLKPPFRRYGGIIIDLACDHQLALRWDEYSDLPLKEFDQEVKELLTRHRPLLPPELREFMRYAERRGLFAAYKNESEILHSLRGVGRRLSRENPLHRVSEIWAEFNPRVAACFENILSRIQLDVAAWLKSRSTMTGS
jgi:acyl carrier protein phosphodiesterase